MKNFLLKIIALFIILFFDYIMITSWFDIDSWAMAGRNFAFTALFAVVSWQYHKMVYYEIWTIPWNKRPIDVNIDK